MFSRPAQHQDLGSALRAVSDSLDVLSHHDDATLDDVRGGLHGIWQTLSKLGPHPAISPILDAVSKTVFALELPSSDGVLDAWISWPVRLPWIVLEVECAKAAIRGDAEGASFSRQLGEFRRGFAADEDGWPINLSDFEQKSKERKIRAYERAEAYSTTEWSGQRDGTLAGILSVEDRHGFVSLQHLSKERRNTLAHELSVTIFESGSEVPRDFLEQHSRIEASWRKVSNRYDTFSAEELQGIMERPASLLSVIRFGEEVLQYGVTIVGRASFLPQTREKLSKFNELVLPSRHDLFGWQFFSSGNRSLQLQLREYRVDWYQLYQEVVSDLLISRGKEVLLAIADQETPARKSHDRVGYVPLPSRHLFTTDHSGVGQLLRHQPYILPFHVWSSPRGFSVE
jgi:hypothetical protein